MKILFMSLIGMKSIDDRNIYSDLLREFEKNGHDVTILSPIEKRNLNDETMIGRKGNLIRFRIGNTQKTTFLEKGISTLLLDSYFLKALKSHCDELDFDLIIYTTPPITLLRTIKYLKNKTNAKTYLLLKDIFPQNALDLEVLSKRGWKYLLYKYFRANEKTIYKLSDYIGCMSPRNVEYLLNHNEIDEEKVRVIPNSIEVETLRKRTKRDKFTLIYGGNLGKPQSIDYVIDCIKQFECDERVEFLIAGSGTDQDKLNVLKNQDNVTIHSMLEKREYEELVSSCHIGLIFLDNRFTIPNYPSRMLSYMQAGIPILAATDINTDVRELLAENDMGVWIPSNNPKLFLQKVNDIIENKDIETFGENGYNYLLEHFNVEKVYSKMIQHIGGDNNV